eukprot:365334-Chlamydomonas_euryale.AAC.7
MERHVIHKSTKLFFRFLQHMNYPIFLYSPPLPHAAPCRGSYRSCTSHGRFATTVNDSGSAPLCNSTSRAACAR